MILKGKNIIVGITGSIAAYKAAMLVRLLVKEGAAVKVIMTPLAKQFITPLTMATLCKNPILVDFFDPENGDWNSHIDLGTWANALLIAPASANTLAKMANGIADNLLLTTYLSARCPVFVAPAMDVDMFSHPTTIKNLTTLQSTGVHVIEPASGELASGLEGKGRMKEPEAIVRFLCTRISPPDCAGKKVMITAGPTYEPIDPVRYIGNHSSGKMGYAIAEELAARGADVILISGPANLQVNHPSIRKIDAYTANQMYQVAIEHFREADAAIMAAAVADFTPETAQPEKIKDKRNYSLQLKPTQDIAAELGKQKQKGQLLVGFALETQNEVENAMQKMVQKNFDFIVLNSLNDRGAGFGVSTNKISIISANRNIQQFELKPKREVAKDIVNQLVSLW